MNKCGMLAESNRIGKRGPVLVLAIFTQRRPIPEFLTLLVTLAQFDSQGFEVGSQLSRELELNADHAKTWSGLDIGRNVIDVNGFLSLDLERAEGLTVDKRIGFGGSNG